VWLSGALGALLNAGDVNLKITDRKPHIAVLPSMVVSFLCAILAAAPALGAGAPGLGKPAFDTNASDTGGPASQSGVAEPGVAPTAPAIRNEIFSKGGKGIRALPIDQKLKTTRLR
jgi:hypothetical protein